MPVEGRGLSSGRTQQVQRGGRLGNLSTPINARNAQTALYAKAKSKVRTAACEGSLANCRNHGADGQCPSCRGCIGGCAPSNRSEKSKGGNYPFPHLYGPFGLVLLNAMGREQTWAKA